MLELLLTAYLFYSLGRAVEAAKSVRREHDSFMNYLSNIVNIDKLREFFKRNRTKALDEDASRLGE